MDSLYQLLAFFVLVLAFLLVFKGYRNVINLYKSLGAKITSYVPLRAVLTIGDKKFQISVWRDEYITISTKLSMNGYLSIERKLFGGGFDVFYDDEEWAQGVLKHSKLMSIIEEKRVPRLSSVRIEGNALKVKFFSRKIDSNTAEDIRKVIELMLEIIPSLERLPSSAVGIQKHKLRNWVIYYIPFGAFLLLSALGFYWREQGYHGPLCEDEIFILGFKVLTPIFIAHFVLSMLILGKSLKAHFLPLFILYFAGYYLIPLTILDPFNAKFDRSEPKKIEAKALKKYHLYRGGFRLVLDHNESCSIRVSESFYKRVKVGDTLVLYVKEGAFGVKWVYRYRIKVER